MDFTQMSALDAARQQVNTGGRIGSVVTPTGVPAMDYLLHLRHQISDWAVMVDDAIHRKAVEIARVTPDGPAEWRLLEIESPEAVDAAEALTATLDAFDPLMTDVQISNQWAVFGQVARRHARVGAADSEPRQIARRILGHLYGETRVRSILG